MIVSLNVVLTSNHYTLAEPHTIKTKLYFLEKGVSLLLKIMDLVRQLEYDIIEGGKKIISTYTISRKNH